MTLQPPPRFAAKLWLTIWYGAALSLAVATATGALPDLSWHDLPRSHQGPQLWHPLGFDAFGRDLLLTVLRASVLSSLFAASAAAVSILGAALGGTLLAAAPAAVQFVGLRALETLLAFPSLLFALAWAAIRGPGWGTLAFSLLLGTLPSLTRLIYTRSRELLAEEFVLAAKSLGATRARIAIKHLLPGVLGFCRIKAPNLFASGLMAEATLSFLGIGAPIGRDSWGTLLAQGKELLLEMPHLAIGSGLPLVLTLLSLQQITRRGAREA